MISTLFAIQLALVGRLDSPTTDRAEALAQQALAKAHEPRGAAPLIRLRALIDEVDELNLLADPISALAYRRSTDPGVRVLARLFLADVERARGKTVRAQELVDSLGFLQDWQVVGSFDNEGKGGCDTDFGPESAVDLRATYPARGREVSWRRLIARAPDGYVDLSHAAKPSNEAVVYALGWLEVDQETKAALGVGVSGAYRLWVNGVKVSASDRYNLPRVDQARLAVNLRKGHNRILLKVCQVSGPLGFYFRAEKPEGSRGGLRSAVFDTVPPLERGMAPLAAPLPTLSDWALRVPKQPGVDPGVRADAATVLAWTRAYDDKEHLPAREAQVAAEARPSDAWLQLEAAELHADEPNLRRRFLEAAQRAEPRSPWVRLRVGEHEARRDHPELALDSATELLRDAPRFAPAFLLKARALEALGEKTSASLVVEEAFRTLPVIPTVAREAAGNSRRQDRLEEAVERARMALSLRYDDLDTRRVLASVLADLGRVDDAVDQHRKVLGLDPLDLNTRLRLAELLAANGRFPEAEGVFEEVRRLAPDDPEVSEREGRVLLHAVQRERALLALTQSLRLRPQNPALKELVRTLRGDDLAGASPHAVAVAPLLAELKDTAGEDAVYLVDLTFVRVQTSGLSSRFSQLAVKVLTQRGVEAFRSLPISYSPDRQEVRVLKARLTKPDGSVVDSFSDQDHNINEPWTGMYYDARARLLTFPAIAPGDVLELQWRIDDTAVENLLSDYWGEVDSVQATFPKRHYRYIVDMPTHRPLYWNKGSLPAWLTTTVKPEGERTVYTFTAAGVPKVVMEPLMPGGAEVATPLHVSTYKTWDDVGRYYWGLVRDQLTPNEELRKAVAAVLKGVDRRNTAKVVAAIYGFVVTNTRYVALEFGIHGYKPYRVDRVLARRFGDCKDKASLIVAMLKVAGVDSRLVLLRMRRLGQLSGEPASLAAFNHAIVRVPALDLYLDGTAEFHGTRELASADRLANVLVVEPDQPSRFSAIPEAQPEENLTTTTMEVTLKTDGSATGKVTVLAAGQSAPDLRRAYQTPASRQTALEEAWAQSFPGVTASGVTVSDPRQLEQPVTVNLKLAVPRYAEAGAGMLRFYPFGSSRTYTQALAPLASRKHDVLLPGVWVAKFSYTYALPPGWVPVDLPEDAVEESPFGRLRIAAKRVDAKLVVDGEMVMSRARIGADEYGEFRAWLLRVDQAFGRKLVVQQPPDPMSSSQ